MAIQLIPTRTREGQAILAIQPMPEACDVLGMMRNLKKSFPKEWRQVNYEIIAPVPIGQPADEQVAESVVVVEHPPINEDAVNANESESNIVLAAG